MILTFSNSMLLPLSSISEKKNNNDEIENN